MNEKRQIFAWAMYDWANSAFATTVLVAVFPIFFGSTIVPEEGVVILGTRFSSISLLSFVNSFAALLVFLTAPVLGAIADYSAAKKKFLVFFCYLGSFFSTMIFFCDDGEVWQTMTFFVLAQIGFVGGNIFYDAFLPQIASEDHLDMVSGKGFAYGYIGGGLQFAISLGIIAGHDVLGISTVMAAKIAMAMAGVWWGGFALITFRILRETAPSMPSPHTPGEVDTLAGYAAIGIGRTIATARKIGRFKHLLLFLIAFMVYNDGIQTVIKMSSIYGSQEIGLSDTSIMITLLIIQFVAFFGALLFGWLAERIKAKPALIITLLLWTMVVTYGYFMKSAGEFLFLGVIVGFAMGGSQALSRSLYGAMIPPQASAEFYGFYSVFTKFSTIWGTALFGYIELVTGSSRNAIVSLVVFFALGIILLSFVNVDKAKLARRGELFS